MANGTAIGRKAASTGPRLLLVAVLLFGMLAPAPLSARAAEADDSTVTTWTAWGTCRWGVGTDGTLWIEPADGSDTGTGTTGWLKGSAQDEPWMKVKDSITAVKTKGTIILSANAGSMFSTCSNLVTVDANFDTSNVENMAFMFNGCTKLQSVDVSGWDTSKVTSMGSMFNNCSSLTSVDVSGWNTSQVTDMSHLFGGCPLLETVDVSKWDTSACTTMDYMFFKDAALASLDVSGWNTSKVTMMRGMFGFCSKVPVIDVSKWDTSSAVDTSYMFQNCSSVDTLDVSGFKTNKVTNMAGMFSGCAKVGALDVSKWDTSACTNMSYLFQNCSVVPSLDVSGFKTGNVTNMAGMFSGCRKVTALDVTGFDTANVSSMAYMFQNCSSLKELDVSGFATSKVTDMSYMFSSCTKLPSVDVSKFDTSACTNMQKMFASCSGLESIDVSGFDTSKVANLSGMFSTCSKIKEFDISSFDTSNVTTMVNMFAYDKNATLIKTGAKFTQSAVVASENDAALPRALVEDETTARDSGFALEEGAHVYSIPTYAVTYDGNGTTSGTTAADSATWNQAWTTAENGYARTGYAFQEWNASADGSGTAYAAGAAQPAYTATAPLSLYAIWKPIEYTVTFDGNGAPGGSMGDQAMTYDVEAALSVNSYTRTGYTFEGWNSETDGSGDPYGDGQDVKNLASVAGAVVALHAQWKAKEYTLTVDPNGGTAYESTAATTLSPNLVYNGSNWRKVEVPTRSGYRFAGYYDAADGGNMVYDANGCAVKGDYWSDAGSAATYVHDGDLTVYARWEANSLLLPEAGSDGLLAVAAAGACAALAFAGRELAGRRSGTEERGPRPRGQASMGTRGARGETGFVHEPPGAEKP